MRRSIEHIRIVTRCIRGLAWEEESETIALFFGLMSGWAEIGRRTNRARCRDRPRIEAPGAFQAIDHRALHASVTSNSDKGLPRCIPASEGSRVRAGRGEELESTRSIVFSAVSNIAQTYRR